LHTLAASFGLFTQSTGNRDKRLLHVYRSKPEGWTKFRKLTNYEMLEFMPRNDDYWMGGARDASAIATTAALSFTAMMMAEMMISQSYSARAAEEMCSQSMIS
jgi:hypothetical protein